jgi:hypothetical protein
MTACPAHKPSTRSAASIKATPAPYLTSFFEEVPVLCATSVESCVLTPNSEIENLFRDPEASSALGAQLSLVPGPTKLNRSSSALATGGGAQQCSSLPNPIASAGRYLALMRVGYRYGTGHPRLTPPCSTSSRVCRVRSANPR